MNKNSLKSLLLGFVAMFTVASVHAGGTGTTSDSAFVVCGESKFKLNSTVTAPSGGSYQWFGEDGTPIASGGTSASLTVDPSSPTTITEKVFKVVVYNANLCPSDSGVIYVKLLPKPTDTAAVDNALFCSAQAGGDTLHLTANNGANLSLPTGITYTYAWTTTNGGTINDAATAAATTTPPSTAGSYSYALVVNYAGLDAYPTTGGPCAVSSTTSITVSQTPDKPGATIELVP